MLVDDIGFDPRKRQRRRARFELRQSRQRRDQRMPGLGLPPSVHNRTASAADGFVIPDPGFRIDRLADGAKQSQALEVVLSWELRSPAHEGPNRRGRGMENCHAVFFYDAPYTILIRPVWRSLVHDLGNTVRHGAVDN